MTIVGNPNSTFRAGAGVKGQEKVTKHIIGGEATGGGEGQTRQSDHGSNSRKTGPRGFFGLRVYLWR